MRAVIRYTRRLHAKRHTFWEKTAENKTPLLGSSRKAAWDNNQSV